MPNRILKDSLFENEKIASLSDFEYRLWTHLILLADDMGRGDARPMIIKGRSFPLRERTTTKDIQAALCALAAKGCVSLYTVGGKPYYLFPSWCAHQRVRDVKPKYPAPEESTEDDNPPQPAADCGELPQPAADCGELPQPAADCGLNPNPNTNPNTKYFCAEQTPGVCPAPAAITLPLVDKTEYPVTEEQCQEWAGLYPAVDVIQQLRSMKGWLNANPKHRKTKAGILRFINGWLSREQNRARPDTPAQAPEAQQKMRRLEPRHVDAVPPPPELAAAFFPSPKPDRAEPDEAAAEARRAAALRALEGGNA